MKKKGKRPRKGLDKKDLEILGALSSLGGKVSAEELAEEMNYAPRTVRSRLKRLKDNGYLGILFAQTHEAKIGLGDAFFFLQPCVNKIQQLKEIIDSVRWFYYTGPTYGKYNGYLVHTMYSMDAPDDMIRLADELVSLGIIDDYFYFVNTDYETRRADFKFFEYNKGWTWDANKWIREAEGYIATGDSVDFKFEYEISRIDPDLIDVKLLTALMDDSNRTLKELGNVVGLSDTQVRRRIDRLEKEGVIKGYRWVVHKIEKPLHIYVFLDIPENVDCILSAFYRLPFPSEILVESRNKYCIRIRLHGSELMGLMRGLTHMRKYLTRYFVQFVHDLSEEPWEPRMEFFDENSLTWRIPVDDVIKRLRKEYGGLSPV